MRPRLDPSGLCSRVGFSCPAYLQDKLRIAAHAANVTVSKFIRMTLERSLNENTVGVE